MSGAMWPLQKDLELHIEQQGQGGAEQVMIDCALTLCLRHQMGKGLWCLQSKMHRQWFWQLLTSECSVPQSAWQFTLNWYCPGRKRRKTKVDSYHTASAWHPCGSSAGPEYVQSPAETCWAELVALPAACQPFCQPYTHHTRLFPLFWLSSLSTNFKRGTAAHPLLLQ